MEREQRPHQVEVADAERIVTQYADLFVQRWDTFARQRDHSRLDYRVTSRDGSPVPLTRHDLLRHLRGDITIGLYSLDPHGHTKWSVIDCDTGLSPLVGVRDRLG